MNQKLGYVYQITTQEVLLLSNLELGNLDMEAFYSEGESSTLLVTKQCTASFSLSL